MKVRINKISLNEPDHPKVLADISFCYNDKNCSCQAEIDLNKQKIKGLSKDEIEKLAVDQVRSYFEEIIANCDTFSHFPVVTIEL
jgi:hypothetical protein